MYCFQFTHVQFVSRHFSFVLLESCFRNVEEKKFILVHIRTICIIVQSLCLLKLFISCMCGFVSLSSKSNILHGISSILYFNLYGKLCKVNYLPFIRNQYPSKILQSLVSIPHFLSIMLGIVIVISFFILVCFLTVIIANCCVKFLFHVHMFCLQYHHVQLFDILTFRLRYLGLLFVLKAKSLMCQNGLFARLVVNQNIFSNLVFPF